ncbi:MAG: phosphoribosylformylglycinamidine cyclo-ligase [candidate division Zixibacteria bacterium]|nr:phosphoribosylformylglycinamidine cyclo-ligase [candidate division Zixibacteria bacterium]
MKKLTYKDSGVDIQSADRAKKKIKALARSTFSSRVLKGIGGFGGFFAFPSRQYKDPVLISSVDGVGTKLKLAFMMNKHDTVGEDLVNHCVNDILVHGARPLFFLDYVSTGKLSPKVVEEVVKGLARACKKSGCALVGGETAEMPEFYKEGEYDLAGCIVGVVEKKRIIDGSCIRPGDQIIGLKSNGVHTNGYSLARKAFFGRARLRVNSYVKELKTTVGKELLKVHRCYASPVFRLLQRFRIKGIAHITGGGIEGNLSRILPRDCDATIITDSWKIPPVFKVIQRLGSIDNREMFKVFNMGIGLILVISQKDTDRILKRLSSLKETAYLIGEITAGKGKVKLLSL